jgi:phage tail-like protein
MTCSDDQAYRFATSDQWKAGAHDLIVVGAQRAALGAPASHCLEVVGDDRGSGRPPGGTLLSIDRCGRLNWLRPDTGQWFRHYEFGVERVGCLVGSGSGFTPVLELVVDCAVVWLLTEAGIERHDAHDFRPLGPIDLGPRAVTIASDHQDGLWAVSEAGGRGGRTIVDRVDRWGRRCQESIKLPPIDAPVRSVAASQDGHTIFVLVDQPTQPKVPADPGQGPALLVVSTATGDVHRVDLPIDDHKPVALLPGADDQYPDGVVTLVSLKDDELVIATLSADGRIVAIKQLAIPPELGQPTGAVLGPGSELVIAGSDGVARVVQCPADDPQTFTFVTPTLRAPLAGPGWNRAELAALLPEGSGIEIDWYTADSIAADTVDGAIHSVFAESDSTPRSRLASLQGLIPWPADNDAPARCATINPGVVDGPATRPVLIDQDAGEFLWLRIRLTAPVGRAVPTLLGLDVLYGNDSYVDVLPPIYQEQPDTEADLRQVLAPFETVFDQLDNAITALPLRIDPATAPDEWTDYLLSWLGLPDLGDLEPGRRRAMLDASPILLSGRGTMGALLAALRVVVDGESVEGSAGASRVSVIDRSQAPSAWFLPMASSSGGALGGTAGGAAPHRLGCDTVARAQQPPSFKAGSVTLGQIPLGVGCPDPGLVVGQAARVVTIRIDVDEAEARALRPIVDRLLAYFVPAHCRVELIYSLSDRDSRSPRLDDDFRLADDVETEDRPAGSPEARLYGDGHWRLGATVRAGAWQLPQPDDRPLVLDRHSSFRRDQYLT